MYINILEKILLLKKNTYSNEVILRKFYLYIIDIIFVIIEYSMQNFK